MINVVIGDMSLIGPRPEVPHYVDMYTPQEREILHVRPGITDWASLPNPDEGVILAGSTDSDETYFKLIRPKKIALQLLYVKRRSLWIDIVILLQTIPVVVLGIKPKSLLLLETEVA